MCIVTTSIAGISAAAINTALAVGAVSAGTAGYMQYQSSRTQKNMAAYQEDVANANAKAAQEAAGAEQRMAEWEHLDLSRRALQETGNARVQYAASGLSLASGTPAQFLSDIADTYDLDSRKLDYNTSQKVYQRKMQAYNYSTQATGYGYQKHSINPGLNASLGGISSGLGGFASGLSIGSRLFPKEAGA
jgi:hypothetical protein